MRLIMGSAVGTLLEGVSRRLYPKNLKDWYEVVSLELVLPRLDPEFDGYRIAQISDFHIGTWLDREKLDEAVAQVNELQPDLVALTGDFVTFHPERYAADLTASFRGLEAPDGVVAILGNHDHWSDARQVRQALRSADVLELANRRITLRRGDACLHIAGVDDIMDGCDDLEAVLAQLPDAGAAILLAHEPDFADVSAATGRFDLQISGHSHGGQILFPHIGALLLPAYAHVYPKGLYQVGDMIQYTNRGLGTAELQIRLNCKAEITLFTLHNPSS